ncbi:phosphoketolase family protein [Zunongwangia atlantica]|uniref:Probable phosphoketolase n=1 Tax=Zunongwangia atlantica 22II14-10F7 TaxID=1185767 RepID=A0A1Y1SYQ3_9FLAO|nr:phosphoketolase family protein [Zunongwangia atlantica]ORL43888.1 phosphoketolase [Zunongwangia atlantica 22II14-10F7]
MILSNITPNTSDINSQTIQLMHGYWRAANYLSVGQIYLRNNPLLKRPLAKKDIKLMRLGHWGTTPGQNFIYTHLNRIIKKYELDMVYVSGPGHGGPALVGNTYLEGSYSEIYPEITQDEKGLKKLFKQFSFPGGIPSHVSPECPGSFHEGGELGYSLAHSFGAVLDNPNLIATCVVGDGEAETGALATSWHSNKFINPETDGVVLPILHLNGYKIANPALLARIPQEELIKLMEGYGWKPYIVAGDEPLKVHEDMAFALENAIVDIQEIKAKATQTDSKRPVWPMIILKTPKGWTGPKYIDDKPVENHFRSHQVPISDPINNEDHFQQLEKWLRSYQVDQLFDDEGTLKKEYQQLAPKACNRMGMNPHTNGGLLLKDLKLPSVKDFAVKVNSHGDIGPGDTRSAGAFLKEVMKINSDEKNFRLFGPDEILSNRLNEVFETTNRQWNAQTKNTDEFLAPEGRAMEILSEHLCEGWLEGYLLTGRHGLFTSYEAFIHIIDSMFNQHAKWLKVTKELPWRRRLASLNILLSSHVWRQDHNGFTHQDPGFIDHVINKKASIIRVYLPPDANCLLLILKHCLESKHYVNVMVAGKHPSPQWLSMDQAELHCKKGIGIWEWASNDQQDSTDLVMACAGDIPTLETLAAVSILRKEIQEIKIRVINVVDLMKLQSTNEHPHGLSDSDFDALFTKDKPVIFAFHAYPWLIHRLTYKRNNHLNFHVRGYQEEGTITTPFDMTVLNKLDRFHLVQDVLNFIPKSGSQYDYLKEKMKDMLIKHRNYIEEHGIDLPEVKEWKWNL